MGRQRGLHRESRASTSQTSPPPSLSSFLQFPLPAAATWAGLAHSHPPSDLPPQLHSCPLPTQARNSSDTPLTEATRSPRENKLQSPVHYMRAPQPYIPRAPPTPDGSPRPLLSIARKSSGPRIRNGALSLAPTTFSPWDLGTQKMLGSVTLSSYCLSQRPVRARDM